MKKLIPLLGLLILIAWGCGKSEKKEGTQKIETATDKKIVARVNGRPIYEGALKGRPLENVIDYEIFYEVGLKQGLDKKFEGDVEEYRKRLIVASLQKDILAKQSKEEITEQEIEEYYKQNEDKFNIMNFELIVVEDQNLANEIHKRAVNGEDFKKIASDYSGSDANVRVQDLRFNRKYDERFKGKEVGSISEVIQEGKKFIILKLTDVKQVPVTRSQQAAKYSIMASKRAKAIHDFAEKAKDENNIKVEILEVEKTK